MTITAPTVGRIVYYYPGTYDLECTGLVQLSPDQALRADVLYVNPTGTVNLNIIDHIGVATYRANVALLQETDGETPENHYGHCKWMPYQVAQAQKAAASLQEIPTVLGTPIA